MTNTGLTMTSRVVGDVAVLYCKGRVVAGDEAQELQTKVKSLLGQCCDVVMNFSEINYIDSSGIGALVTLCSRGSAPNGQVVLSNLPEKVRDILTITKLVNVFEIYESEARAIFALYGEVARARRTGVPTGPRLLCVDSSNDLLSYLREILQAENYQVLTTVNLADALLLLKATRFSLLLLGPNFIKAGSSATEALRTAAARTPVVSFHENEDAAVMARDILSKIDSALSSKQSAHPN